MNTNNPLGRARLSLEGLSVADAFGQCFFGDEQVMLGRIDRREVPVAPWFFTDDTAMTLSVYRCLAECGKIVQDRLAELFAEEYAADPRRGYGGTAHAILRAIGAGGDWRSVSAAVFSGMGSMGNGAAMRVAPIGAYLADDIPELVRQARWSAEVTHAHEEGKAGAIAVALAAAWAWRHRAKRGIADARPMLEFAWQATPDGETRSGIRRALDLPFAREPYLVAQMLGSGLAISAPDTVPFALWCAARHCWDFEAALWATASGLGDVDTTCAIVGGIVALSVGFPSLPRKWLDARGPLPSDY